MKTKQIIGHRDNDMFLNIQIIYYNMENLTKEMILETLHKNRTKIRRFGVKKLILFGSFARDEQKENSDIDFLVEFEKNRGNYDDFIKLQLFLEDTFNKKIDLLEPEYVRKELKSYIFEGELYETRI